MLVAVLLVNTSPQTGEMTTHTHTGHRAVDPLQQTVTNTVRVSQLLVYGELWIFSKGVVVVPK